MKVTLLVVHKTDIDFVEKGILYYKKKLERLCSLDFSVISATKKYDSENEIKIYEGKLILDKIKPTDYIVLLDNNGKTYDSKGFANFIQQKEMQNIKQIVFVIGGAYGFSNEVYERANEKISMSSMTFSHQIVRVIFLEQLYRAYSINNGLPYHHA